MYEEWIPVVDNAVKIGLGGLIAGVFAWLVARHTSQSSMQRLHFERRSKILSDVAQQYEIFFQAFLKLSSHLQGMTEATSTPSKNEADKIVKEDFNLQWTDKTMQLQLEYVEKLQNSFTGQSHLMLLGEPDCMAKAQALHAAIVAAHGSCRFDGKKYDLSNLPKTAMAVRDARIAFYDELKKAFNRMPTFV